jgi:hypothetical protein
MESSFPRLATGAEPQPGSSRLDLAQFPRFVWADEDASVNRAELARRLLQVAVPALPLAALGAWRLRRYAIV